jgi:hypothetical protein
MIVKNGDVIAVWFSCGAASAVAAKKTLEKYGDIADVRIVNNPIIEEHPDNRRFLADVEHWLGVKIELAKNSKYPECSCVEVWEHKHYMAGVEGAPCTLKLKKHARVQWEERNNPTWHVMGYTFDEQQRSKNFYLRERSNLLPVLIEEKITKSDCFRIIKQAGLKLPAIYDLGFPNANCIGCVKAGSPTYWNHVRRTFHEIFEQRAEQSRRIGAKLVKVKGKRIFLDELDPEAKGRPLKSMNMSCSVFCTE